MVTAISPSIPQYHTLRFSDAHQGNGAINNARGTGAATRKRPTTADSVNDADKVLQRRGAARSHESPHTSEHASSGKRSKHSDTVSDASDVALFFILRNKRAILLALRNLYKAQTIMGESMERLATGRRINSAADDAAGLAIANRLSSQIVGLRQASANARNGLSLAGTAQGTLTKVNNHLQHIRELSVKAANGTNSAQDLESIQNQINAVLAEIDRIANKANFNNVKLFDNNQSITIQVGADDQQTVVVDLAKVDSKSLGLDTFTIDGYAHTLTPVRNAVFDGVRLDFDGQAQGQPNGNAGTSHDVTTRVTWHSNSTVLDAQQLALMHDANGRYFARHESTGTVDIYSVSSIQGLDATHTTQAEVIVTVDTSHVEAKNTAKPLATVDSALHDVTTLRSSLGATQNRLNSVIADIATTVLGLTTTRSRLMGTNYAVAISRYSRAEIMHDASIAVLAQANQSSHSVSALLR